jgi:RNA polymerase sigma-70 factor, ECF subfamily
MSDSLQSVTMEHVLAPEEMRLVEGLRNRDERAFEQLIRMYQAALVRVALMYVSSRAIAEDVVQESWVAVLNGIDRFEGRSSLKTWIFRIVANRAKTRGQREARSRPFSSLETEPSVDPDRFVDGQWAAPPESWPEERLLGDETLRVIGDAIEALPPSQRAVITLRDIQGWSPEEVRNALELSETNERVLLHRARSKVRAALEEYLMEDA